MQSVMLMNTPNMQFFSLVQYTPAQARREPQVSCKDILARPSSASLSAWGQGNRKQAEGSLRRYAKHHGLTAQYDENLARVRL